MTAAAAPAETEQPRCSDCPHPIDPVALPRHPSHDLTAAQITRADRRYAEAIARIATTSRASDRPTSRRRRGGRK